MSINIAGLQPIDDPEYRYKMPKLLAKIEGRGNGIKTVIVNCPEIATSLHRNASEITKFFGCELGAQSKYDDKSERSVVNGAFEAAAMQQHLAKYIQMFVLCPDCKLPETKYKFKAKNFFHKCYACGGINEIDMNHKLTTFIMNQHAAEKRKGKGDKEDKKKKKKERANGDANGEASPNGKSGKEKKDKKDKKEKKEKRKSKEKIPDADEVTWHTDLSSEAVAARAEEAMALEAAAQNAMAADDTDEVVATLDNLEVDDQGAIATAVTNLKSVLSTSSDVTVIVEEVRKQQTFGALPLTDRLVIFFDAAFNDTIVTGNQIATYARVLEKLVSNNDDQLRLIALCERLCIITYPTLVQSFPVVLKLLYDEDILDEDVLISWSKPEVRQQFASNEVSDQQAAQMKTALKPFIEWLENAEEESDEE